MHRQGLRLDNTADSPQNVIVESGRSGTSSGRQYRGQPGNQTRRPSTSNTPLVTTRTGSVSGRPAEGPSLALSGPGGPQYRPSLTPAASGVQPPAIPAGYGPTYAGASSRGAPGGAPGGGSSDDDSDYLDASMLPSSCCTRKLLTK